MSAGLSAAAIGGIAAGVGSVASAVISSNGAKSAAQTQANAANAGIAQQAQEFNTVQGLLQPFQQAGTNALNGYNNWSGVYQSNLQNSANIEGQIQNLSGGYGSAAQQQAINGLLQNPLYTTSMNLGQQAILANASATGGLRGGNTIANLGYLPGQVLSNVMQQQIGNLGTAFNAGQGVLGNINSVIGQYGNLVNLGENAAAGTGQAAMQTGNNITSLLGQQGAIGAGATLAGSNAITGGINNISGLLGQYLGSSGGGGGGGGYGFSTGGSSLALPSYLNAAGLTGPNGISLASAGG